MSFRSTIAATTAFLAAASAHMVIQSPVPYSLDKLDNSPISKAQFPCKVQNGFTVSTMNTMAVGETQKLEFKGSAVHGGGSCQLSVTLDTEPTANSVFKVIKSIEGGCPGVDGPKSYEFTLPDSIPNGKASFAWSWFAKLSGQPEMYMNCAPIEVTGGASDDSAFQQLPDMFVANLDDTCKSPTNKAVKFPNPGTELEDGGTGDLDAPTGSGCGSTGSSPPAASSGAAEPSSAPSSAPASGPSSAPASGPSTTAAAPSAAPTNTGGVFAPSASSAKTTLATNGAIVCNGTDQFGLCNNGSVVFQPVAAGTTCEGGKIAKRGYNGRIARPQAAAY
ncbi:lytic polysaccharide monooxygenase [Lentithecium fluviatile CBS 122367]|uniref:Lytic polysaccharide monooxygenase n=1 Tax=Lentithecium fluviatile CBS 122367 TaxID=1168545 RepID=A0A6G1ISU5_9PLEO|nr:lytic polysaccharide monooxygenase [Lentithecium fluviatile CBS 122367]